jgi:spore germination protein GerM
MSRGSLTALVALIVTGAIAAWLLFITVSETRQDPLNTTSTSPSVDDPDTSLPTIPATLFYVAEQGTRLVGREQAVPEDVATTSQARLLIEQQLLAPEPPLRSAVPEGTMLLGIYISDRGDAFVDFSREINTEHPGGSLEELFTIYAIVNTLTINLPSITAVQILIEGEEVDTLAGHIDLRRPLAQSLRWVEPL